MWILSLAVAYECTRTITSIYPDKDLIDKAARCVGVFLVAKSNDIKYLGKWLKFFFDMNNTFSILQIVPCPSSTCNVYTNHF